MTADNPGILIAEKEEFIRWALKEYLQQSGFVSIFCAQNGEECVEQVLHLGEDITIVILDISGPPMNGLEAWETLQDEFDGTIGIIFMSGFYPDAILDEIRSDRNENVVVLDFFQKPFDIVDLRDAVRRGIDTVTERRTCAAS